ncbi:tRNA (adenine-N(1)-)-methyltransferase non-catalytic subunit TRM6 [Atta colombica]|uniref:tRNA (adenine(58)-N(1))-methyltransferase non-catalytic subunit TRM6 n=1 Tax=Atta colombica TaxID=520822 RepID=A0A195BD70_9HYME|nr:tRNA (adenine-N(1)-)-methyltransferase non-catalytic subunit TRM6 [Atta colombica]
MSAVVEDTCESEDVITVGIYVIVKKQDFSKIYKVSENGIVMLGKNQRVEMQEIIGKPFWSTFEMMPLPGNKGSFTLKLTDEIEPWNDLKGELSGCDNRSITDDGTSQRLSKEEILQLQEAGKTGKEIIIYFKRKHEKIGGLRMDALAQMLSYSDVQSDGLHLLYSNGFQGLPAAAMINRIGMNTNGYLINLHPGNIPQTTFIEAMNFPQELKDRHLAVNIYSFLRLHYQELETEIKENGTLLTSDIGEDNNTLKRKLESEEPEIEAAELKKPKKSANKLKWLLETKRAVDLLSGTKARGLTIVAKEHPLQIANALLPFLGISRPFVIFHAHREPLQETYIELKQKRNVINMKLFTNFLRSYQVLPNRTHPDILTNDTGGYILTGYLVE